MREIPLYTPDGVRDADVSTHWFHTEDGLGLSLLRFQGDPADEAILVIHGLTTSTDMFIMPEHDNLVSYLLDQGYGDVWCLDYRMSNRHPYNLFKHRWSLDDVALYDFPPAIAAMREEIGDRPIHVIAHCLGAATFAMSLFAGLVDVTSVVLNSVALTPRVPGWSRMKLRAAPGLIDYVLGVLYVNPRWSEDPGITRGELVSRAVSFFHRESDIPACHMLSMMWGTGRPALSSHDNLAEVTHRRSGDLYGATSVNYLRHAPEVEIPILFMTDEDNKVFTDSNIVCHQRLDRMVPGRHQLHVIPGYGHQDPFMGKDVARDVFPRVVSFIDEHREDRRRPAARTAVSA